MKDFMGHLSEHLQRRSVSAVAALEGSFAKILLVWMGVVSFMCGLRIAFAVSPIDSFARLIETILP
jgi:hypothetical protein